jgi:hypothetical protein
MAPDFDETKKLIRIPVSVPSGWKWLVWDGCGIPFVFRDKPKIAENGEWPTRRAFAVFTPCSTVSNLNKSKNWHRSIFPLSDHINIYVPAETNWVYRSNPYCTAFSRTRPKLKKFCDSSYVSNTILGFMYTSAMQERFMIKNNYCCCRIDTFC